jgi:release factor glutamine methyltransferase
MSLYQTKQSIKQQLSSQFEAIELNSLLSMLMEHVTGWNQVQQAVHKDQPLSNEQINVLNDYTAALLTGKPIQYIIGKSWFMGNELLVNENVLIPRPETEELVEWIIEYAHIINKPLRILDIGTGSGCIPVSLKNALPDCSVTGLDISKDALLVAAENAKRMQVQIDWVEQDILMSASLPETYDVIVSNPPYIPLVEQEGMDIQVKGFEPSIALFVPDEDPLIFYRMIARLAKQGLSTNGQLFFEIHYDQAKTLLTLLDEMGYHAECRQDMFGKDRMIRARLKERR